jgi:ABC-type transport system involved in cytochrome c biogenesis permease subunit
MTTETAKLAEALGVGLWVVAGLAAFAPLLAHKGQGLRGFLKAQLIVQCIALAILSGVLVMPLILGAGVVASDPAADKHVEIPAFDLASWRRLPVQEDGRKKPFESMAVETLRGVSGRSKFQGHHATAVVLQWMLLRGEGFETGADTWEHEPFILCPDGDLREVIYSDVLGHDAQLTKEHIRGSMISPRELRKSETVRQLLLKVREKQEDDSEKMQQLLTPLERKASEVNQRLSRFDAVSQNSPLTFHKAMPMRADDPIGIVALDRKGGGWFSIGMLRLLKEEDDNHCKQLEHRAAQMPIPPLAGASLEAGALNLLANAGEVAVLRHELHHESAWRAIMRDRLAKVPQLYTSPERLATLRVFQEQIKSGTAHQALDELSQELAARRAALLEGKAQLFQNRDDAAFLSFVAKQHLTFDERFSILLTKDFSTVLGKDRERSVELFGVLLTDERQNAMTHLKRVSEAYQKPEELPTLAQRLESLFLARDAAVVADLKRRVAVAMRDGYHPADERFRMLHLNYLENRFPNLYIESAAWQAYPREDVNRVLASFAAVQDAYRSRDAYQFERASEAFFAVVREVGEKYDETGYPGTENIALEMQLNRVQPFKWGWISMLACVVFLTGSLSASRFGFGTTSGVFYGVGWLTCLASLAFQGFGFYARIVIAERAPVSNIYETIIFVAAMSVVFAIHLELKYRRVLILLSGAVAGCLALMLADQLPNANVPGIDEKIKPLTPVLRTNYWLTVHVLTIVASYAGGALAWVIGNIAIGLLAFGNPSREALKSMSQFSYRAMQIAVVLLAAGTFLGGWWAVESWGRFWGWDPKEVWALISLVCYVIPLHARYVGWVKDFGLAVSAVLCFAAIMMSWYGVNFVLGAGLHSYGFGGGGPWWVAWVALLNLIFLLVCCIRYTGRVALAAPVADARLVLAPAGGV